MAQHVLLDAVITVNAVDISGHVYSVEIEDGADEVDVTTFGDHYKEQDKGLKEATVTLEVFQDFDLGEVDATLWPLYQSGETFEVTVKADSAPTSEENPQFRMQSQLYAYSPIAGGVGDALTTTVIFRNATLGLTRAGPYVGIDSDSDPYFDAAGWFNDDAGVDSVPDPYIDVDGADEPAVVFDDDDGDIAIELVSEGGGG